VVKLLLKVAFCVFSRQYAAVFQATLLSLTYMVGRLALCYAHNTICPTVNHW